MSGITKERLIKLTLREQEIILNRFQMHHKIRLHHDKMPKSTGDALSDFLDDLRKQDDVKLLDL